MPRTGSSSPSGPPQPAPHQTCAPFHPPPPAERQTRDAYLSGHSCASFNRVLASGVTSGSMNMNVLISSTFSDGAMILKHLENDVSGIANRHLMVPVALLNLPRSHLGLEPLQRPGEPHRASARALRRLHSGSAIFGDGSPIAMGLLDAFRVFNDGKNKKEKVVFQPSEDAARCMAEFEEALHPLHEVADRVLAQAGSGAHDKLVATAARICDAAKASAVSLAIARQFIGA